MEQMAYREEDYDSVHDQILDSLRVEYEEWSSKLSDYKNNINAKDIIKSNIERIKRIANKIRPK